MSATEYSIAARRARAARRAIEVAEWAKQCIDEALVGLRAQVVEEGHALRAHDDACHHIDRAQSQLYDALSNLRCSR